MNKRKSHSWMFSLFELRVSSGLGYVLTMPEMQNMKNLTFLSHVGYSWANTLWDCSDKEWKPSKRGQCTSWNNCLEMWAEGGTIFLIAWSNVQVGGKRGHRRIARDLVQCQPHMSPLFLIFILGAAVIVPLWKPFLQEQLRENAQVHSATVPIPSQRRWQSTTGQKSHPN